MTDTLTDNYVIRKAMAADASTARDIAIANFTETWGDSYSTADLNSYLQTHYALETFSRQLASDQYALFLLERHDPSNGTREAIGHAFCGPCSLPHADIQPTDIELKRLYILKTFHNLRLGHQLMTQAMQWMLAQKPPRLWLGVYSENHGAQRFYARYGFKKAGEYFFVVGDTRDHEFILSRQNEQTSN
jgi:diamine N-acetyltransferase